MLIAFSIESSTVNISLKVLPVRDSVVLMHKTISFNGAICRDKVELTHNVLIQQNKNVSRHTCERVLSAYLINRTQNSLAFIPHYVFIHIVFKGYTCTHNTMYRD